VQPINWRSDIMNFTLSLIYPPPSEEGLKNISVSELVCVVTADQTCSSSFFSNMLRFIDSGARHSSCLSSFSAVTTRVQSLWQAENIWLYQTSPVHPL
jgi:hypothetical protein